MGLVGRRVALLAAALVLAACSSETAGVDAAAVSRRLPPVAGAFDYQLGGAYPPALGVRIVDRDRAERPVAGRYNICYVNAFQTQPDEARFWLTRHPTLLLKVGGRYVHDPDWPGEYLLDTSTAAKRTAVAGIVGAWFDGCAARGFQAVEPDNLDSWTRSGVRGAITRADNLALATLLVRRGHAHGLAVAQKNTVEVASIGRSRIGFDFAIAEECETFRECGGYLAGYGRQVIEIEYTDNPLAAYTRACAARRGKISIILRDRDVVPRGSAGYHYAHC